MVETVDDVSVGDDHIVGAKLDEQVSVTDEANAVVTKEEMTVPVYAVAIADDIILTSDGSSAAVVVMTEELNVLLVRYAAMMKRELHVVVSTAVMMSDVPDVVVANGVVSNNLILLHVAVTGVQTHEEYMAANAADIIMMVDDLVTEL